MKKKLSTIFSMVIILINIFAINVSALSFTTSMTPNNTKIEAGTEVVVYVKLSSIEAGEDGINMFTATLGYDANVFEILTETNIEGSNDWQVAYDSSTGKITLTKTSYANSDQEIMQITLKVKSGVGNGTKGSIELSNVRASTPKDDMGGSNVSTTITIGNAGGSSELPDNKPTNTTNQIPTNVIVLGGNGIRPNNQISNNSVKNNIINTNTNVIQNSINGTNNIVSNQTEDNMPYTGSETTAIIQIIMGIIIIALLIYRKIDSLNDI